ncbi:MAG: ROK family protein [Thermoplasmata archaeon]|nr:ROK family protein [Thermoplasmata archaeon]
MARTSGLRPSRILGVDVGATKLSAAVVDADGRVLSHGGRTLHRNEGPDGVIRDLLQVIRKALGDGPPPEGIGVGVAGQVEAVTGTVRHAPNLRWTNFPLGTRLSSEFGCPVFVANDVRAATVGEWRHGAGKGTTNLLCLFVGTGVGGSAVVDGRLLEGAANALGEVGHTVLVSGGRACHCPAQGCLEAYVGGWAIAERARERVRIDPTGGAELLRRAGSVGAIEARTVAEAAHGRDPLALEIMRETAGYLGSGVAGLVNAFNPARLLLGGGVIEGSPELVDAVAERVRTDCQPPAAAAVRVMRVSLGHDAILIGAAELARDQLGTRPFAAREVRREPDKLRGAGDRAELQAVKRGRLRRPGPAN